jgi:hypothetical protein
MEIFFMSGGPSQDFVGVIVHRIDLEAASCS